MLGNLSLSIGVNFNDCRILELFDHLDILSQLLELEHPVIVDGSNEQASEFEGEEASKKLCVHVLVIC